MKIVEIRFLRGPNVWSRHPCLEAVLDLEDLEGCTSTDFPGLAERLCAALPALCGRFGPCGLAESMRKGIGVAHIVEHVLLELPRLAQSEMGFGPARAVEALPVLHRVVVWYRLESVVSAALPIALRAVEALCRGRSIDLEGDIERLRAIASRAGLAPGTRAIVEAAQRRGIPQVRVGEDGSLVQLGWGKHQKRVLANATSNTSQVAVSIAGDKHLTKALLIEAGVPVPPGEVVASAEEAVAAARRIGGAVVVKLLEANRHGGVLTGLASADAVRAAFERARRYRSRVMVERCLEGADHRVLVVNGQFLAACRRVPPQVIGDGWRSVLELVEDENRDRLRNEGRDPALTRIPVDDTTQEGLARQGLTLQSIPPAGMCVRLRDNANLSTGATAQDVTDRTHPEVAAACVRAAEKIGLDLASIDLVCRDIAEPLEAQGGGIVEVNADPGLRTHEAQSQGERHGLGEAIVDALYPPPMDGRIPLLAVTGAHGKTTTSLLIAHGMQGDGLVTGAATTHGIRIGDRPMRAGERTGYDAARTVLASPEVEAAVLEAQCADILRRGLAFDRCDVAVVLNTENEPPGPDSSTGADATASAQRVVVAAATRAVVLNADDTRCVAMAADVDRGARIVYFAMEASNRVLLEHLDEGGSAVYVRDGRVIVAIGEHRVGLIEVSRLGFALNGRARFNVDNALAAAAALWACGFDRERIAASLASFRSSVERNPLRLNVFIARAVQVILDSAHDPASYRALIETARALGCRRVVGVAAAPGDSRKATLREIGAICARGFDELIVFAGHHERHDRAAAHRLARAAREAGGSVAVMDDVREAARAAFARCRPGDLLVCVGASDVRDLLVAIPDAREVADFGAPQSAEACANAPASSPLGHAPVPMERRGAFVTQH